MNWILIIRWIIFATFIVLLVESIAVIIFIKWFYARYVTRHSKLEKELDALQLRVAALEGTHA